MGYSPQESQPTLRQAQLCHSDCVKLDTTTFGLCMHQNAYAQNRLMHSCGAARASQCSCKLAALCLYTLESGCAVSHTQCMLMRFQVAYP